ncbi:hypothetical protein Tco_0400799 [Tanacetum coccineum]
MSPINPFNIDDIPVYIPGFSSSIPTVREDSSVEESDPNEEPRQKYAIMRIDQMTRKSGAFHRPLKKKLHCAKVSEEIEKYKRYKSSGSGSFNTSQSVEDSFNLNVEAGDDE